MGYTAKRYCKKYGHSKQITIGEEGMYCLRCGQLAYSWDDMREAIKTVGQAIADAFAETSRRIREYAEEAEKQEEANIEKAREILGGES